MSRATGATIRLATPSAETVTRTLCGPLMRRDDIVLVGNVRNALTHRGVDSAIVFVKWINLALTVRGTVRSAVGKATSTQSDGWYVMCGVPAGGTIVAWAQHGAAVTGAVPVELGTV
ncbi:MAG: hypothetical protein P3A28_07785, partial [Gemmatimonadota bacterium]|nr:hypothetical protein [Gemmatimonadota bacterium]